MKGRAAKDYDDFFSGELGLWWKLYDQSKQLVSWMTRPPCGHQGQLATKPDLEQQHKVTEHQDGTISVEGSIQCQLCGWHGHLTKGEWTVA